MPQDDDSKSNLNKDDKNSEETGNRPQISDEKENDTFSLRKPINEEKESTLVKPKSPPIIWKETQGILQEISTKFSGSVVSYFTRKSIVGDDVKYFYNHLKNIGHQDKIFLILISGGGDGKSAFRIASLLREFCDDLIVMIPEVAASAATMLCLAADKIIMTPISYLTAVDVSITHPLNPLDRMKNPIKIELEEIKRSVNALTQTYKEDESKSEIYKTIFNYIHPAAFGALERSSTLSEMLCMDILNLRRTNLLSEEETEKLIRKLNEEYPSHGYPITYEKAKSLGLPVEEANDKVSSLLWSLHNIYRFVTDPARTDFNESYFHREQYLNIIESVGRRMSVKNTFERRLDPIIKGWTTLRDEYNWKSFYEVEEGGETKLRISNLDF